MIIYNSVFSFKNKYIRQVKDIFQWWKTLQLYEFQKLLIPISQQYLYFKQIIGTYTSDVSWDNMF